MIQVKLDEVLEGKGHTLYWLAKETGISHNTLWRMNKGLSTAISFDVLDRITDALECMPGDILVKASESKKKSKDKG